MPTADQDAWLKSTLGLDTAGGAKPGKPLPPAGPDQQSQAFQASFQQLLGPMDEHLGYLAANAEAAKRDPLVVKRETLVLVYQAALAQVDPADDAKAKPAMDKALAGAQGVSTTVAVAQGAAQKALADWQSRQPKCAEASQQIEEMAAWGHAKAPNLRDPLDAVRGQVEARQYAEATAAFDGLQPQVQPVYDEYQKQKAAQQQYEPARKEVDPRLAAAGASHFTKLEPLQQAFGPATSDMDGAASAKDFVRALQLVTDLAAKLGEYEKALAELEQQKQAFETEKAVAQPKLDEAKQAPAQKKLEPLQQDLATAQSQMEAAAQAEDFVPALDMVKNLGAKADAFNQAIKELEEQKKAYEEAAAAMQPRLAGASQSKYKQLVPGQAEIAGLQASMDKAAGEEDYPAAQGHANELSPKLDALEKSVREIEEKKKRYEDGRSALQPKLDAVGNPPRPKLALDEQAIAEAVKSMEKAAADEDFDSAAQLAGDLGAKADAYASAAKELEDRRRAYEEARGKVQPRVDKAKSTQDEKLAPMQQAVMSSAQQMEASAQAEDYDNAAKSAETLAGDLDKFEAAATATTLIEKDFKLPVPALPKKTIKVWGNRIEIEIKPTIEVSGHAAIDSADGTQIDMGKLGEALLQAVTDWDATTVHPALTDGKVWHDMKVGQDGTSFAASATADTPLGTLALKATLVGFDKKLQGDGSLKGAVVVGKASASLTGREVKLPDQEIKGLRLTNLKVSAGGEVEIAPAWLEIIAKWAGPEIAKSIGKTVGQNTALGAGEVAALVITVDAVIVGALIIGGVATIGGAVYAIVQAWGIGELAQSYRPSLDEARAGFKAAMSGQQSPAGQYGKAGHQAGVPAYHALLAETTKKNPEATEDVVKQAIALRADEALGQVSGAIDMAVRTGLWDGYLGQHTTMLNSMDAKNAFVACFGDLPREGNPQWKKYAAQHPIASKL